MMNIVDTKTHNTLLCQDVHDKKELKYWFDYYKDRYGDEFEFVPVIRCDCCGEYSTLH